MILHGKSRLRIVILMLLASSVVILIAVFFFPADYSLLYGFGYVDKNDGFGVEQGFSYKLHNEVSASRLKQMIRSIGCSKTESIPEYGECFSIDITRAFGQHDRCLIVYSPEQRDFFFHNKNGWHIITDLGPIHDVIQESIYYQAPFGFRYELYESHLFMPRSHLYHSSDDDLLFKETRVNYRGDGFEHKWNGKIERAEEAFILAKSELGYTNAAATWCFSPDGNVYDITIVSMEADVSSPGWWEAENRTLFNVIVGENGIIQEIYSYSTFGVLDPTYLDYTADSFSQFVDMGIVLVG